MTQAQERLRALKAGTRLISADERAKVEKGFTAAMHAWSKRKGIFKSIWCADVCHQDALQSTWTSGAVGGQ